MMTQETIKKLKNSTEGEELIGFIKAKIRSLDRASDIPDEWDDRKKAVEITARKRAATILAEIFKPLFDYEDPKDSEIEIEDPIYFDHLVHKKN